MTTRTPATPARRPLRARVKTTALLVIALAASGRTR